MTGRLIEKSSEAGHINYGNETNQSAFRLRLEERVGHLLRRAYQRHVMIFHSHLKKFDLTAAQYIVLARLLEHGTCSQSDLARHTAIDHTTIRGIITRLRKRDLLTTQAGASDARKITASLTPHGKTIAIKAFSYIDKISEETFNGINEAERIALKYLLSRIAGISTQITQDKRDVSSADSMKELNPIQSQNRLRKTPYQLQLEDRIGYLLRRAYQRHVTIFQHYLNEFELTAAQYVVLAALLECGPCSQSDVSRHTVTDHASIRGIINRLSKRELLFSEKDSTDARKVAIFLTDNGRALTSRASARIDLVSKKTYNGINIAEQVALKYLLRRIADIPIDGSA